MLSRAHYTRAGFEGLLGVQRVVQQSWTHGPSSTSSVLAQHGSRFKTADLTDRPPVAHLASNTHEAELVEKKQYALICQSYSNKEAPFISANPFVSFTRH